jgi:hypothetical protein
MDSGAAVRRSAFSRGEARTARKTPAHGVREILLNRSTQSVQVENVFLRRQLSLFKECGIQARRIDATTSTNAAVRARCCAMAGCAPCSAADDDYSMAACRGRLFWRSKCRPDRPTIPVASRALIRRMAGDETETLHGQRLGFTRLRFRDPYRSGRSGRHQSRRPHSAARQGTRARGGDQGADHRGVALSGSPRRDRYSPCVTVSAGLPHRLSVRFRQV